eukprot:10777428-Heterocapsa_arctica.AAC.1
MFSLSSSPRPDPLLPAPSVAPTTGPSVWNSAELIMIGVSSLPCLAAGVMLGLPSCTTTIS